MGKKSKRNRSTAASTSSKSFNTNNDSNDRHNNNNNVPPALRQKSDDDIETKDNLKFESPFVDETYDEHNDDDEDIVVDDDDGWEDDDNDEKMIDTNSDDDNMNTNNKTNNAGTSGRGGGTDMMQSWNPLSDMTNNNDNGNFVEKLEIDLSAYKMYHAFSNEWPSLSYDFIRDNYGECRTRFPHKVLCAVGTQADTSNNNSLTILKISDMAKIHTETDDDILGDEIDKDNDNDDDSDDDESEEEDEDDDIDLDPSMEHYSIKHTGGVNRVRVMPQRSNIVATWADTGTVHLFNIDSILNKFDISEGRFNNNNKKSSSDIPKQSYFSHTNTNNIEGYAMDWSNVIEGNFVTGANNGTIHTWKPLEDGTYDVSLFYTSTTNNNNIPSSVEDIQWSPTEATVFATGEAYGYVRIFDTRAPNRYMLSHKVQTDNNKKNKSNADVNVLSWNHLVSNLLATGSDDGTISVWDLRNFSTTTTSNSDSVTKPLARFTPHKTPISSIEWHPTDESMLTATDDVGCYVYDLSVEEDIPDANTTNNANTTPTLDIPPQLLFVHSGSEQFKEVHWHPQIPSCLMTTALSGFSIFIPSNL